MRSEHLEITLRPEDPALVEGFYAVEPGPPLDRRAGVAAGRIVHAAFIEGFTIESVVYETPCATR